MKKKKVLDKIKEEFLQTTETLWKNEVDANLFVARILINTAILDLAFVLLIKFNVLFSGENNEVIVSLLLVSFFALIIPAIICFVLKGEKKWLKILMLIIYTIVLARIESILTHNVVLAMVFPIILSIRYYSQTITFFIGILTLLLAFLGNYISIIYKIGRIDLNMVELNAGTILTFDKFELLRNVVVSQGTIDLNHLWLHSIQHSYMPKAALFIIIIIICTEIAAKGRKSIFDQKKETQKSERVATELHLAEQIQRNFLPNIFPPFPDHKEFELFANMIAAKEVGGDFFDFYFVDNDHLALIIADVSGKGIPGAMMMMATKILIKNTALVGNNNPAYILDKVNKQICSNNSTEMFVTAWLGILEISSGKLIAANAGHEYPYILQNGKYNLLKDRHGLVLGALENSKYTNYEVTLAKGDGIFVYTDGVTEATDQNKNLFTNDRLTETLNKYSHESADSVIKGINAAINIFSNGSEQFDDITMLSLIYHGPNDNELTLEAIIDNIPKVTEFVDKKLEAFDCPLKIQMQIDVAIDELFSNIAKFAYRPEVGPATVKVEVEQEPLSVIITFIDKGKPYDPLSQGDPDVTLSAEEREIGGLGIYLVKKTMDDVNYEYKDGQNILTIKKEIK